MARRQGWERSWITLLCLGMWVCSAVSSSLSHQALLSMGFPRQDYWSELPFPSPGELPDPGIKPKSPASPALQANA